MLDISPDFFRFIRDNASENVDSLRLKFHGRELQFDVDLAIDQIECRRKTARKLPLFNSLPFSVYPSIVASEQASHEAVAKFHASLISPNSRVADMTAGLGIDSMAMANVAAEVTAYEIDSFKAECLTHNCHEFHNINVVNGDSVVGILSSDNVYDFIFVDPARRGEFNSRVYNFHDCLPDILKIQSKLLSKTSTLIIKASPLLDISQTLKDIPAVCGVYAVSVNSECKEVLLLAATDTNQCFFEALNLDEKGGIISRFHIQQDNYSKMNLKSEVSYAVIDDLATGNYLYEPDASVMKLSPWHQLCKRFPGIRKFDISSHLFVSESLYPEFPGRILRIDNLVDNKMRKRLKGEAFCVATRNYPLSAVDLRKKLGVKEGRERFIYGSRLASSPILVSATRQK